MMECCACALSRADTQAVVVWLCKDLGLLCEQIEVPCPYAEVARAVLAGECMERAGVSRGDGQGSTAGHTWGVESHQKSAQAHLSSRACAGSLLACWVGRLLY